MLAVFAASYVIGSLNSAIIATRVIKHKDIREYGSFNAGLTNVYRCFGPFTAAVTLVMDLAKGIVVVFGTRLVFMTSIFEGFKLDTLSVCMISSLCAVLGHCFPAFYKFKGGKGILLASMCMLCTDPMVLLAELILFVSVVAITRYISVGSMAACVGYPVFTMIWQYLSNAYLSKGYENIWLHVLVTLIMFMICFARHFSNIQHLWAGNEKKFYFHKKGENEDA